MDTGGFGLNQDKLEDNLSILGAETAPQAAPSDSTGQGKGKGTPKLSELTTRAKRNINRSSIARAAGQRQIALDAHPTEFLVAVMQGEMFEQTRENKDGEEYTVSRAAGLSQRVDIAKFLTNKLVGNAAQHQAEDAQGKAVGDWVKQIEAQAKTPGVLGVE